MNLKLRLVRLVKCNASPINFFFLYRFASKWEYILLSIGCVCTLVKASVFPFIAITYAEITSLLVERSYRTGISIPARYLESFGGGKPLTNATVEENDAEIINDSIAYLYVTIVISVILLGAEFISLSCFNYAAVAQVKRLRIKYFTSLMRQEIGWYDLEKTKTNFTVRLDEDIDRIKAGMGEHAGHFMNAALTTVLCILTAFIFGWQLTLIIIVYFPIVFALHYIIAKFRVVFLMKEFHAFNQAANFVDKALVGIRAIVAVGAQHIEVERYKQHLVPIQEVIEAKAICACIEDAAISFLYFLSSASVFWFGVNWVLHDRDKANKTYTTADLITVFINWTVAVEHMVKLPSLVNISTSAHAAATHIFAVIDHRSKLDPMRGSGKIVDSMKINGDIEFKDVAFGYPSCPDILSGLNLTIEAGQRVALVGISGSGKSTCLRLLQRFYDPNHGSIWIGGYDIRSLNMNSLRSCIACINKQPALFSTTIAENIRYGRPNATDREIMAAARSSGAHEFIVRLPLSYSTVVGDGVTQLSDGQKQQIAIARAIVQDPKVLLLDESTAALDHQSQKHIQDLLDRASKGRTTIFVSHRLADIQNADRIVVIHHGQIVEDGTHSELIASNGYYYEMVKSMQNEIEREDKPQINNTIDDKSNDQKEHFKFIKQKSQEEANESNDTVAFWESLKRIPSLLKSDWTIISIAICSSIILGLTTTMYSVILAEIYGILSIHNKTEAVEKLTAYCLVCVGIGVLAFIAAILQTTFFAKFGAKLAQRLRLMTFAAILRQECGWLDRKENPVGNLTSCLSGDVANVQNAIGFPLSIILQSTTAIVLGIIIAFAISLKLSIVCMVPVIAIIVIALMEERILLKSALAEKDAVERGMKVASEAITNIQTVASLRQEKAVVLRFSKEIRKVPKIAKKSIVVRSLLSSMNQMISKSAYGFALCYGGVMVAHHEIYYKDVIRISELLLYGFMTMGQSLVFAPTVVTALIAIYRLLKIIDRNPRIGSPTNTKNSHVIDQPGDVSCECVITESGTHSELIKITSSEKIASESKY